MDLRGVIVSLNEIEAIALKASRGAGMDWGLAEEAGRAARWLARHSLDPAGPVLALLEAGVSCAALAWDGACLRPDKPDGWLCPIAAGAFISDVGPARRLAIERVLCPVLILPFAAAPEAPVEIGWEGVRLRLAQGGVAVIAGDPCAIAAGRAARLTVEAACGGSPWPATWSAAATTETDIDDRLLARLAAYEALTYVPASRRSRAFGAGAGETDND